ncbi:uncharacterized protein FIESC28_08168 [Fusarium coffeatum]|uniref:Uncharacterized protein n=1 Tax=Fusarium coffeatum TaxID=231269 RepID=A0A366RA84_9HYPO|nr:uncharacterized protein FIESC28_08168 [Fusarium coffeatum]RBR13468.1 hypothetical protein FIESC28_08168 [Fusarium coffeatum]
MPTPTWSWLYYPGSIVTGESYTGPGPRIPTDTPNTYESKSFRPLAMLCRAKMFAEGISPYAIFDKAVLEIRCLLIPMELFAVSDMEFPPESYRWDQDTVIQADNSIECLGFRPDSQWREIKFSFEFSRLIQSLNNLFLLPLYIAESGVSRVDEMLKGIIVTRSINAKEREFTRVGTWLEDFRFPSQIIPVIRNTIIKQGIGIDDETSHYPSAEQERVFDSKLRSYSVECSSSDVKFPVRRARIVPDPGSCSVAAEEEPRKTHNNQAGQEGTGSSPAPVTVSEEVEIQTFMLKHSSLPHFSKAEWTTVSLV